MSDRSAAAAPPKARASRRNPAGTHEAILEAAGRVLAKDGPEGLSVSRVARLAGVNRGTAYQHFRTRQELLDATTSWVSQKLRHAVFGDREMSIADIEHVDPSTVTEGMASFAMDNPELGRAWLFEMLNSSRPGSDPFWKHYKTQFEVFARSNLAQPGIDGDVFNVMVLIGTFLWPVFARAQTRTAAERQQLAQRFSTELLRLSMYGTMRPEKFAGLEPTASH